MLPGATFVGDVSVTGGRVQIGGTVVDLRDGSPSDVKRAIIELVGRASPEEVVQQLEAASTALDARKDISDAEVVEEIVKAYSGPRDISITERLKATAGQIAHESAVGAA